MDKKRLNKVSQWVSFEAIPKPKQNEELDAYIKRCYPKFEEYIQKSKNPVSSEMEKDSDDDLLNAVSKVAVRRTLVKKWCAVNDPFNIKPPSEATAGEILKHNGIQGTEDADEEQLQEKVESMIEIMGQEQFDDYIDRLKTPKKDGLTKTEIAEKEEEHYAKYTPAFPSEKTCNSGKKTREFFWASEIQKLFVKDHKKFLSHYDLEDKFHSYESDESEDKESDKDSD